MKKIITTAKSLLLNKHGTLTRELLREPGGFGLGQVPSRLKPDATTTAVCGWKAAPIAGWGWAWR